MEAGWRSVLTLSMLRAFATPRPPAPPQRVTPRGAVIRSACPPESRHAKNPGLCNQASRFLTLLDTGVAPPACVVFRRQAPRRERSQREDRYRHAPRMRGWTAPLSQCIRSCALLRASSAQSGQLPLMRRMRSLQIGSVTLDTPDDVMHGHRMPSYGLQPTPHDFHRQHTVMVW